MKKLFNLFAVVAVVLGMASCGDGNSPEQPSAIKIKVQQTVGYALITVTPADDEAYFYYNWHQKKHVMEAGGIQEIVDSYIKDRKFKTLVGWNNLAQGTQTAYFMTDPKEDYVVVACVVEKDEDGYAKIVGNIVSESFTAIHALPGEFSIAADKKVRFAHGNTRFSESTIDFAYPQWSYLNQSTGDVVERVPWTRISEWPYYYEFYVPSADEWWYMLKERPHADELFAPGTIDAVHGLILLPDEWQMPEGVGLKTGKEMGIVWDSDEDRYSATDVDGYAQNVYTDAEWMKLEYAGAVFLPATESSQTENNVYGWYWSSTESVTHSENAHAFSFSTKALGLSSLKGGGISKSYKSPVRTVCAAK